MGVVVMSPHNMGYTVANGQVVMPALKPRRTKLAILGGMAHKSPWPTNDPTWEVWCCNAMWVLAKDNKGRFRADRWFELHPWFTQSHDDIRGIMACPVPIYLLPDKRDEYALPSGIGVPNGVRFPFECLPDRTYFTNTFAYQLAFAIGQGFTEIGLFGVTLIEGREALIERPCLEYWIGYARAKGITVTAADVEGLGKVPLAWHPYRYGYDYDEEKLWTEQYCQRAVKIIVPGYRST